RRRIPFSTEICGSIPTNDPLSRVRTSPPGPTIMISSERFEKLFGCLLGSMFAWFALGGAGAARAEFITALVSGPSVANALVTVNSATPNTSTIPLTITGTTTNIIDIDYRPANGLLYGLGVDNRIYTIDTSTGAATQVSSLSNRLSGTFFGIDFNPVADRLRIVSDIGQNLRVNVDSGAVIVDG